MSILDKIAEDLIKSRYGDDTPLQVGDANWDDRLSELVVEPKKPYYFHEDYRFPLDAIIEHLYSRILTLEAELENK